MKNISITICILVFLVTSIVSAQSVTVKLAWNYDQTNFTKFVLERKTGLTWVYADLPLVIPGNVRIVSDETVAVNQIYCWRIYAELTPHRSPPSNEICTAVILTPAMLRFNN